MQKLINYSQLNGKKRLSENLLLKTLKDLQKVSKKNYKKFLKLCLIYITSIFKLNTLLNTKNKKKKKIIEKNSFIVIKKKKTRTSTAVKFISKIAKNGKANFYNKKLCNEILSVLKNESSIIKIKNDWQEKVVLKKHIFSYYRWR